MELYLIKDFLNKSIEEKKLYFFQGYDKSNDYCGYVLSYNTDSIQILHYTRYGEKDGIINLPISYIRTISIDSDYIKSIQEMIEYQERFLKMEDSFDFRLSIGSEGQLSVLQECLNNRNLILTIETNSESFIGFVDDIIASSYFVFTEIYSNGLQTETAIHKLEDIKFVRINDKFARKLLFLYNNYQKRM